MGNSGMNKAKFNKKDEFYTQLEDIEKELIHYLTYFKDKIVYCNCDNPLESNFWNYFIDNFEMLGLKQLIATYYNSTGFSFKYTYNGSVVKISRLSEDGDFRSDESIELLKDCDIVCTNPPFSLFRDYVSQLISYDKDFLIIGNINSITSVSIFPYIQEGKMSLGHSIKSGDRAFRVPNDYPLNASGYYSDDLGNNYVKVKGVRWFTNIKLLKENDFIHLTNDSDIYSEYDNYDAINISRVKDIPINYKGIMGVPITFIDKFNPKQFELVGMDYEVRDRIKFLKRDSWSGKVDRGYVNNKRLYSRLFIRHIIW